MRPCEDLGGLQQIIISQILFKCLISQIFIIKILDNTKLEKKNTHTHTHTDYCVVHLTLTKVSLVIK